MVNKEAIKVIEQQLKQGYSRDQITTSLVGAGWDENDVNDSMSFIAQTDPSVPQEKPPKKSKKKIIMILGAVAIFLTLTIGALGSYYFLLSPERVLQKMVMNLSEVTTLEYAGEIETKVSVDQVLGEKTSIFEDANVLGETTTSGGDNTYLTFSGKSDISNEQQPKILFSFNIRTDLLGDETNIGLELRVIQEKVYINLSNVAEFLAFFGLESLDGQWIEVESSEVGDTVGVQLDTDDTTPELMDVLAENPEIIKITEQLEKEDIDGVNTHHYAYEIDKAVLIQILTELSTDSTTDVSESFKDIESISGEIWVGSKDYYPYKLTLNVRGKGADDTGNLEELNLTLFMKNFNQPVQIDVPSDSKTIQEIMSESQGSFMFQ